MLPEAGRWLRRVTRSGGRTYVIRKASARDVPALAQLWHDAWHDAHGDLVPSARLPRRTPRYSLRAIGQEWQAAGPEIDVVPGPDGDAEMVSTFCEKRFLP